MDDAGRFEQLIKAGHCSISITTHEERYALEIVRDIAAKAPTGYMDMVCR